MVALACTAGRRYVPKCQWSMQYCVDLIDFVCKILRFTIYFNDFAMKFIRSVSLFDETRVFVTEFIRVT